MNKSGGKPSPSSETDMASLIAAIEDRVDVASAYFDLDPLRLRAQAPRCDRCRVPFTGHRYVIDADCPLRGYEGRPGAYLCLPCFFATGGFRRAYATIFLIGPDSLWWKLDLLAPSAKRGGLSQ